MKPRIELHLHTMYSTLDGVGTPEEYIKEAKKLGMTALGITDHGTVMGVFHFYEACKKEGIIPVIGCELYMAYDKEDTSENKRGHKQLNRRHLNIYAKNEVGLKNLYKLSSMGWDNFNRRPIVFVDELLDNCEGLVVTSACVLSLIQNEEVLLKLKDKLGDDFYLEIQPLDLSKNWDEEKQDWGVQEDIQRPHNIKIIDWAKKHDIKMITTMDAHYPSQSWKEIQDIFILNSFVGKKGWRFSLDVHHLMDTEQCWNEFVKTKYDEIFTHEDYLKSIDNSYEIVEKCKNIELEKEAALIKFPYEQHRFYEEGDTAKSLLMKCILNGKKSHLLENPDYLQRLKFETNIIDQKGFYDYFLIVEDVINWNIQQGFLVGPGRGSVGGSLLAYLLGIHYEDPIEYGLLFERFMSIDRSDYPDIDIDFERQEETKDYLSNKYGRDNVAAVGAYQIIRLKTAIKDAYRVLRKDTYNFNFINGLTSRLPMKPNNLNEFQYFKELIDEESPLYSKEFFKYIIDEENTDIGKALFKMLEKVRVLKIHPCAVVISEKPIKEVVPIFKNKPNSKEEVIGTAFDGDYCQKSGLVKFDILSLNTLKDIGNCIRLIKERKDEDIDIYSKEQVPLNDPEVLKQFAKGDTDGVFQFNTPLLQGFLRKIGKKGKSKLEFNDLVVMNAAVRPGPLEAGFPDIYIKRKLGELGNNQLLGRKVVRYRHPKLDEVLKETYGVIIYQEQIMKAFGVLGGFSPIEQNHIRKAVSKSNMELLEAQKPKFMEYATTKLEPKWTEQEVEYFYKDVIGFGRYAFNKSHAVEYSHLAYICQWLKVYYPIEWWAGLLINASENDVHMIIRNRPNFFSPVDVNKSGLTFLLERNKVRMSFNHLEGIGDGGVKNIVENQPFTSLEDFIDRTNGRSVRMKTIETLIVAGAFKELEPNKSEVDLMLETYKIKKKKLPEELERIQDDPNIIEKMRQDRDPFYTADYIEKYKPSFSKNIVGIEKAKSYPQGSIVITGGKVKEIKIRKTKTGKDFARMKIVNGINELDITCWSEKLSQIHEQQIKKNEIIQVKGTVDFWNKNAAIVMQNIKNIKVL